MRNIKRPLLVIVMGVLIGIIWGLYFNISIAIFILIILPFTNYFITKNKKARYYLIKKRNLILIILISTIISNLYFNFVKNDYQKTYKNMPRNLTARATIISEPAETEYYLKYKVKISNKKFILYINKNKEEQLQYGMQIQLKGEYQEPEDSRNYKGFSYKEYLKTQNIYGSIKAEDIKILKKNNVNYISIFCNNFRNKIIKTIEQIVSKDSKALLTGILIGEQKDIQEEVKEDFRDSNLSHIVAISGSHISYIIIGISYVLVRSKISKRAIYIITIIGLVVFMFLTNFSPSVVRACIMGITMIFSKLLYRKLDILTSMAFSLLLILIKNPYSINDIGLQLSYTGTLGIVILNKPILEVLSKYINKKVAEILSVTLSAQILILPITLVNFNNISTIFLISNLLAVPLSGIIILLGYANVFIGLISIKLGKILGIITDILTKTLMFIAKYTAKIPFANIIVTTPNTLIIITYYVLVYCVYKKKHIKRISIIFLIIIIISNIITINIGKLTINFIDVGQRR